MVWVRADNEGECLKKRRETERRSLWNTQFVHVTCSL